MKKISICICLFIISFTNAQNTITTTGSDFSGDNFSISYTVGQLKVNTIDNVNSSPLILDFLQGVQYGFDVYDCRDYNSISFSVYPNPASDIVSITFSLNETAPNSLKIINVLGQEIKRIVLTSSDEVSLKTSQIPHGLYFIQVRNGDNSMFVKKLMIR